MSVPNQGQTIAAFWEAVIGTKPTNNIFNSMALFYMLKNGGFQEVVSGGNLFEFSLEYAINTTFKSYGEFEQLDTTRVDVFDCARYNQKIAAGTINFSDLEIARAQDPNQKFALVDAKLQNGKTSAINSLNVMLNGDGTGNGGKDFNGVVNLISTTPTSGIVGGINRSTFSFWRNRQASGAKTTTAFDNLVAGMRSIYNQCSLGGVENTPTGILSDRASFEGYESTLVTIERLNRTTKAQGGDSGFLNDAIQYKAAGLFYDESAEAGSMRFLNPKFLKLPYLKGYWMKMLEPVEPANQLARVNRIETFGNLCTNGSRYLGVLNSIT